MTEVPKNSVVGPFFFGCLFSGTICLCFGAEGRAAVTKASFLRQFNSSNRGQRCRSQGRRLKAAAGGRRQPGLFSHLVQTEHRATWGRSEGGRGEEETTKPLPPPEIKHESR